MELESTVENSESKRYFMRNAWYLIDELGIANLTWAKAFVQPSRMYASAAQSFTDMADKCIVVSCCMASVVRQCGRSRSDKENRRHQNRP
jgi:hypothetical protein